MNKVTYLLAITGVLVGMAWTTVPVQADRYDVYRDGVRVNTRFDNFSNRSRFNDLSHRDDRFRNTYGMGINDRQAFLQQRILLGVRNGTLTRQEAFRLQMRAQQIASLESQMRSDGSLSFNERMRLQDALNRLNNQISRQTADRQVQPRWF